MKKIWFGLGVLVTIYLVLPGPKLPPPDLPESLKSTEIGDTVEIENLSAYFTDKTREEVIDFYESYFSRSSFLNIPLPTIRLNHPPEYARDIIKGTIRTYYFEELVHPFRESLYINGFDWQKDVFTPEKSRDKNRIFIEGKVWRAKITLRWFPSSVLVRTGIFWATWILVWLIGKQFYREFKIINHELKRKK
jgi:hypothetical protein